MNKKQIGIYMIMNLLNNKVYVGSSKRLSNRRRQHFSKLTKGKHHNSHLQNAFNKYGRSNFVFIIIEQEIEISTLYTREIHWIKLKGSLDRSKGYNLCLPTEAHIRRLSKAVLDKQRKANKCKPCIVYSVVTGKQVKEVPSIIAAKDATIGNKDLRYMLKEKFDTTKDYRLKKYISKVPAIKKIFRGNPVEAYDPITLKTIQVYPNVHALAEAYNTKVKYVRKCLHEGKKSHRGVGIRFKKKETLAHTK